MTNIHVSGLMVFPVKSLRGGPHDQAHLDACGFAGDRRWMVVDPAGHFMTQREHPLMATIQATMTPDGLVLASGDGPEFLTPHRTGGSARSVRIWKDEVAARDEGDEAASWLSGVLQTACRLVHLGDSTQRRLAPPYARHPDEAVSFADGFPVLLTAEASLDALNDWATQKMTMLRFRPNLVVTGNAAFAEDTWRRIRIGETVLRVAKPCDRCIITTLDPETGQRSEGNEPLRALSMFRRDVRGRIMFGQNLVPERGGRIHVGDPVEILEQSVSNVFGR